MTKTDERAEMIGSSILAQAKQESNEIIAQANQIRESEIRVFEDQIITDMFGNVQRRTATLRADSIKAISKAQSEARRGLLHRREELATMVMCAVWTRLFEYSKTPAYAEAMKAGMASLADKYDHSTSTVYLREADIELADTVKALLPGSAVEIDPAIKAGGWRLENTASRILIDETLDNRLATEKSWFLLHSGLRID
jgi:vacuolar-type H+-ATPase subunit E/Vma4